MTVEMVLNELSHQVRGPNIYVARKWLFILQQTILAATSLGVKKVLRTGRLFYEIQVGPNYFVSTWLNDSTVNYEERLFFQTIATKYPYLQDFPPSGSVDDAELSEFYYQNEKAEGFRYAYWMEALAISFLSHPRWDRAIIDNISVHGLNAVTAELQDREPVSINHASRPEHLDKHKNWIIARIHDSIQDGYDIWYRKEELYPNLFFAIHYANRFARSTLHILRSDK